MYPEASRPYIPATKQQKDIARSRLRYAVSTGVVVPQPCEKCGKPKTHGHHTDYSKPLAVQWLCHEHHKDAHTGKVERELRAERQRLIESKMFDLCRDACREGRAFTVVQFVPHKTVKDSVRCLRGAMINVDIKLC